MSRRLPPLNQLRAFEAAARHESIKDGAEELCVTPTAVGHQIKALEQWVNTPVFLRKTRKVILTKEGRALAEKVEEALDQLASAVDQICKPKMGGTLKITVAPFFGNRWLIPRLPEFHALYPDITIKPFLCFDYVALENSDFDAAVRYGSGNWKGFRSTLIYRDLVKPVCAPQLVQGFDLPMKAKAIIDLPIAYARDWSEDWQAWADVACVDFSKAHSLTEFENRAFMFDAALSGQAVILADSRMTAADEEAGRLISLSLTGVERPQGIYVVSQHRQNDPRLGLFIKWLRREAAID